MCHVTRVVVTEVGLVVVTAAAGRPEPPDPSVARCVATRFARSGSHPRRICAGKLGRCQDQWSIGRETEGDSQR